MDVRQKLSDYGARLLSRRDYSVAAFRKKLAERARKLSDSATKADFSGDPDPFATAGTAPQTLAHIDEIIERFVELDYLSDARYRDQWIRAHRRRYGSLKIVYELSARGIDRNLLDQRRAWLQQGDLAACFVVWRAKFGQPAPTPKEAHKHRQFLAQRGFDFETIAQLLRAVERGQTPQTDFLDDDYPPLPDDDDGLFYEGTS